MKVDKFKFDDETIDLNEYEVNDINIGKVKQMNVNIENHGQVTFNNFGANCVQTAHIDNLIMPKKKNKKVKRVGDITLKEYRETCKKYKECEICPLYTDEQRLYNCMADYVEEYENVEVEL